MELEGSEIYGIFPEAIQVIKLFIGFESSKECIGPLGVSLQKLKQKKFKRSVKSMYLFCMFSFELQP